MSLEQYIAALKQERDLAIKYRADKIAEIEKGKLARCAEECEKQSEYEGGLLDSIAELEKVNGTLHKLMVSGEKRGVDKATQEFKLIRKELIEEFAEAECMGDVAKIARNYGYEE